MQDSVFINNEVPLFRDTYITTLRYFHEKYTVSFEVKPLMFYKNWATVIYLTTGVNTEQNGNRNLAVFFTPDENGVMRIYSAINHELNNSFDTDFLPLNIWSSIKISQQLINRVYIYSISVNGIIVYSTVNLNPSKLMNVKVYAADPWHIAQSGLIRNLIIISEALYGMLY